MKTYFKPLMIVINYRVNENITACYKIKCETPNRNATYHYLYDDSNDNGNLDNQDHLLYSNRYGFRGCNKWHIGIIIDHIPESNGFVSKDIKGNGVSSIY